MIGLRLALIGFLFTSAILAGAVGALFQAAPNADLIESGSGAPRADARVETAPLVERLSATGLFPAVEPPSQIVQRDGVPVTLTDEALGPSPPVSVGDEAAVRPGIAALVRRGDAWSLYANGAEYVRGSLSIGDELYDGWVVVEIRASSFVLERDEETQQVNVFMVEEDA